MTVITIAVAIDSRRRPHRVVLRGVRFRRWVCPIGTASELLWKLGWRMRIELRVTKWIDVPLRAINLLCLRRLVSFCGESGVHRFGPS